MVALWIIFNWFKNVDANEITSDNSTIFFNLNVSGFLFFKNALIKNNSTILSSLNVSGYTPLDNTKNINGALYVSGLNILEILNNHTTDILTLFSLNVDVLQKINHCSTEDLSILFDNSSNTLQKSTII